MISGFFNTRIPFKKLPALHARMKRFIIYSAVLFGCLPVFSQEKTATGFTGQYRVDYYPDRKMNIYQEGKALMLEVVGQGKIELLPVNKNTFSLKNIPHNNIEFIPDSLGNTKQFIWLRPPTKANWIRIPEESSPDNTGQSLQNPDPYSGRYSLKGGRYLNILVKKDSNNLTFQIPGETVLTLIPLGKNSFIFRKGAFSSTYEFIADKEGRITRIISTDEGPVECSKMAEISNNSISSKHSFVKRSGFTEADTLMGTLSPLRTCYDVQFYDLDVQIDPDVRSILGSTIIRFKAVNDFKIFQIDLSDKMNIEKIVFQNKNISFTRKFDAVFIQFPDELKQGSTGEIRVFYSGKLPVPDISSLAGGFISIQDRNGKAWIESVVQGSGASIWWPCKDHLSDKPDSMQVNVTIPQGLTVISNGRFLGKTELPGKLQRFQWFVGYPINNYNVVLYIGDYIHFADEYAERTDRFALNYYCLSYNEEKARKFVQKVKPLLRFYQKLFGPYPFPRDGFALVESPYGMEHQSAVSAGAYTNPSNDHALDTLELQRMLWHESAHEWWGNSVTCSDMADFWIHESFASYAEILCYENFYGREAAQKYINENIPENKEPIIGFYGVNDFHMGDMYSKGGRMIATLREAIYNDSLFFSLLKGIQSRFKYQSVSTEDIIHYFNEGTRTDYTYLFDQYLRFAAIPKLIISKEKAGKDLDLRYKWKADVPDFRLPVKLLRGDSEPLLIYPTTEWKTLHLTNTKPSALIVDNTHSYFDIQAE